jgi:hypothetical protein
MIPVGMETCDAGTEEHQQKSHLNEKMFDFFIESTQRFWRGGLSC